MAPRINRAIHGCMVVIDDNEDDQLRGLVDMAAEHGEVVFVRDGVPIVVGVPIREKPGETNRRASND